MLGLCDHVLLQKALHTCSDCEFFGAMLFDYHRLVQYGACVM